MSNTLNMADGPVAGLPAGLDAYGGYVNDSGIGATFPAVVAAHYPEAHCLSITTDARFHAACFDMEKGGGLVSQAPGWYVMMKAADHWKPCFYTFAANMPALKASISHIPRADYRLWVASWGIGVSGAEALLAEGYDAVQYENMPTFDMSLLKSDFFPAKAPVHHDPPKPHGQIVGTIAYDLADGKWTAGRVDNAPAGTRVMEPKDKWRTKRVQVNQHTGAVRIKPPILKGK